MIAIVTPINKIPPPIPAPKIIAKLLLLDLTKDYSDYV